MLVLRLVISVWLCTTDVAALLGKNPNTAAWHVRGNRMTPHWRTLVYRYIKLQPVVLRLKNTLLRHHRDGLCEKMSFSRLCASLLR